MSWLKRRAQSDTVRHALCWTMQVYIRFVWATNRWTVEGREHPDKLNAAKRPYIGAFWHGRLAMMPFGWPRHMPLAMLISAHRDGRIIADAVRYFGIDIIAGSSNRGAREALIQMVRALKRGSCIAITPDGPDGPAMAATAGIIQVARLAQAPIEPITYATSRRIILDSWDRFHLPLPFGRGLFLIGKPIEVPADADEATVEHLRGHLETRLREMTDEADRRMGHAKVAPGTMSRDAFRAMRRAAASGR